MGPAYGRSTTSQYSVELFHLFRMLQYSGISQEPVLVLVQDHVLLMRVAICGSSIHCFLIAFRSFASASNIIHSAFPTSHAFSISCVPTSYTIFVCMLGRFFASYRLSSFKNILTLFMLIVSFNFLNCPCFQA